MSWIFSISTAGLLFACGMQTAGQASEQLQQSLAIPVHAAATALADGCENSPGPVITLNGSISEGGLIARLFFQNNADGTHTNVQDVNVDFDLIPKGQTIQIPKQPSQGGSGGNPFLWVQWLDGAGNPLSGEIFLGRCVQGLAPLSSDLLLPLLAWANVQTSGCSNNPGPYITLSGDLSLGGLTARIIFRNNDNPVGGPHETVVTTHAGVVVIPAGQVIVIHKQPVLGGVGGNPWIYLQFLDGDLQPLDDKTLLGRCVQLSKSS
jgi:hypothetical protein